jgi:UDP-glucuronate 4-epimerase
MARHERELDTSKGPHILMRALVTGCAGFIGSHLTESLLEDGCEVVGVDCFNGNYARREKLRNLERARGWDHFDFVPIDLARGDLQEFVAECDVVFHLAAEPGVRSSWGKRFETYVRNNVVATQHLLDAARAYPGKRLIYSSSSSIYGQAEIFPTPEDVTPAPRSPYGVTKLTAEHLCSTYHANFGVDAVMLRYFSVYGPRQRPDMAFSIFCTAALDRTPVTVFGDGTQTRDFTYVADVVAATRQAAITPGIGGGVYNIGGGSQISLNDGIAVIEECAGRGLDVVRADGQYGDVRDTSADATRARAELGLDGLTPFEYGLAKQFEWFAGERASGGHLDVA